MKRTRALLLPAVVLSVPSLGTAAEPSLQDTVLWLRGNLTQVVGYDYQGVNYKRILQAKFPSDCKLVLFDRSVVGDKAPTELRFEAPLAALDPAHHQSGPFDEGVWSLEVPASGGKGSIAFCSKTPCERNVFVKSILFLFADATMPARASKALSHAIRLCGGKEDPF